MGQLSVRDCHKSQAITERCNPGGGPTWGSEPLRALGRGGRRPGGVPPHRCRERPQGHGGPHVAAGGHEYVGNGNPNRYIEKNIRQLAGSPRSLGFAVRAWAGRPAPRKCHRSTAGTRPTRRQSAAGQRSGAGPVGARCDHRCSGR
eukprot:SAG22_NODE_16_length_32723_cov_26.404825_33_plen_146_part_00